MVVVSSSSRYEVRAVRVWQVMPFHSLSGPSRQAGESGERGPVLSAGSAGIQVVRCERQVAYPGILLVMRVMAVAGNVRRVGGGGAAESCGSSSGRQAVAGPIPAPVQVCSRNLSALQVARRALVGSGSPIVSRPVRREILPRQVSSRCSRCCRVSAVRGSGRKRVVATAHSSSERPFSQSLLP